MTSEESSNSRPLPRAVVAFAGAACGFLLAFLVFADPFDLGFSASSGRKSAPAKTGADESSHLFTCGMHPEVLQKEPGTCPICQMDLVPLSAEGEAPAHDHRHEADLWTCPMHPEILEEEAGTCPICGMDLVPAEPASPDEEEAVRIDPSVVQNMNVRTERILRRDLSRPIRTVGYLDFDQERMVTVTTKYSGWVEEVYVNYVGEPVKKGQPLFEVYSPELVQTEQELLSALDFAHKMRGAPADSRRRSESLVEAARVRLGYWDISREQIRRLEETREVFRTLTVVAPSSGLVMKRMAGLEGMAVQPGMEIFHIADLRSLWLSVEIFEDQVAWVREGTAAEITLPYFPGKAFRGTVRFLEPEFSEATRTLRVKIEVPNRGGELKKGMFATVVFDPVAVVDAIAVPSEAILRTGRRDVVVVALGEGRFAPREVVLGYEAESYTQILEGVEEGEELVISAQFLLDSEAKLRAAIRKVIAESSRRTEAGS